MSNRQSKYTLIGTGLVIGLGIGVWVGTGPMRSRLKDNYGQNLITNTVYTISGEAESVGDDHLVLRRNNSMLTVYISDQTKTTLVIQDPASKDKKPTISSDVALKDLQVGDQLIVKAERIQDRFSAKTLTATRRK